MRYQDYIIRETARAFEEVFRYAKATPRDKHDWSPLDVGRTVLGQCREMADSPKWTVDTLTDVPFEKISEESAGHDENEAYPDVEACEAACRANLEKFFDLVRSIPDEKLPETRWLPVDGGRDFTVEEMMDYPRWNFVYHLGQIGYIQTLLGDREDH